MNKQALRRWMIGLMVLAGTLTLVSCSEDRVPVDYETHVKGWGDPASAAFHGDYAACAQCHGANYETTASAASCRGCHAGRPDVVLACTDCHAVPPRDDAGLPRGFESGAYGSHGRHSRYACSECHAGPSDPSHADEPPAEVSFDRAEIATVAPFTSPVYTLTGASGSGNGTCSNVYCHSSGRGGPPNEMPPWVGGSVSCVSCHDIPPADHSEFEETRCHVCHTHVDPSSDYTQPDGAGILFAPGREGVHVNGVINVQFPY